MSAPLGRSHLCVIWGSSLVRNLGAVAKALNIDTKCWSYRGSTFKQQWDELLPPTAK
jgi:hypothetical protein